MAGPSQAAVAMAGPSNAAEQAAVAVAGPSSTAIPAAAVKVAISQPPVSAPEPGASTKAANTRLSPIAANSEVVAATDARFTKQLFTKQFHRT